MASRAVRCSSKPVYLSLSVKLTVRPSLSGRGFTTIDAKCQDNWWVSTLADVGAGVFVTGVVGTSDAFVLSLVRGGLKRHEVELHARARARQAEAAVTEASFEAGWFAPDEIRSAVEEILALAHSVWLGPGREVKCRADRRLIERWAQSVIAALGDGVQPVGEPAVDILQVINRVGEDEDRIELRVRLAFRRAHHRLAEPRTVNADFRWTLGRVDRAWRLLSVDSDPLADQVLDRPFIVAGWADFERLREETLRELGDADAVGPEVDLAELISPDLSVHGQLVELAVLDSRFDQDLLSASIAHIVQAWEEACSGSPKPLALVTSPEAFDALLRPAPGDETRRLLIKNAVVDRWDPTGLVLSAVPPEIEISLTVSAVRFIVENLDGSTHAVGSIDGRYPFDLSWTLALTNAKPAAWALAATTNPAIDAHQGS